MKKLVMDISIRIPEAKTREELRRFVRDLLVIGSEYSFINYKIDSFKIREE